MTLESLFHSIELRLSKKMTKRSSLTFALKTNAKWRLKILFIFIELRLSKNVIKRTSLTFTLKVKPKWRLKVLFIFIELRLSKNVIRIWFCFENKGKITVQSPFHFDCIATFVCKSLVQNQRVKCFTSSSTNFSCRFPSHN